MSSKIMDNNDEALSSADADNDDGSSPNYTNNSSSILRRSPDNKAAPDTNNSNARPLVVTFSAAEDDARRDSNVVQNHDTTGPLPISALHRNISNQSTIDSALSGNSHLDADDPCVRRMFGLPSTKVATVEKRRRVEILLEQCEALRFPFKKRLLLANLDLSQDDVPVETICSDRLGAQLYKLSLAGNPLCKIPEPLVLKLTGLRVLDISQCGLHVLPERWELPNLKRLNLSHNRLEQFPSERIICGLPDLQALELYGNKISQLTLPRDASELSKLDYLDVGSNILTSIPDDLTKFHSLKTFKCMNNTLEIIPPAVCEMDLRVFDVSSNPLVQPPLETCERGLHSMRRYYHALKLEEMAGPESSQASPKTNILKTKHQRSRSKMRKRKDFVKRVFPASLRPSCVFRSVSTESASGNSLYNSIDSPKSSVILSEQSPDKNSKIQKPPVKSVSIHRSSLDVSEAKDSVSEKSLPSGQVIHEEQTTVDEKQLPNDDAVSDSDDSRSEDGEIVDVNKLVGLNNTTPKKVPGGITVNDTLKVMFVGNAMSGKTSIIKRLIEGKDATIPRKDERTIGVDIYNWDPKDSSTSLSTSIPQLSRSVHGDDIGVKFSIWDFAGQHVYHATHELFYSSQSLYIIVWDMGVSNPDTTQTRTSFNEEEKKMNAFKLTYDSSDDEDEDFFDSEQQTRRARRALEMDVDTKLQFWIDCIQMTTPGAAILPIASCDDYFDGNSEEAILRCQIMKERLRSHEERRVKSMQQRLKDCDSKLGVDSEQSLRLRRLLSSYNRPKIIFGDGPDSVVRVSSTHYTGFSTLASRIINIATGQERGGWKYPIFHGHVGVRIPRMRLEVRDVVRSMRDRFKVVEWNFFLAELEKKGIGADQAADVSDALLFLQNIGELSYFGEVATDEKNINKYSQATIDEEGPISRHSSVESSVNSIDSLGLSDFIFLNPRWLVAAVACILRHDLSRELLETKRNLRNIEHLLEEDDSSYTFHDDDLPTTQSYPVITSHDTVLLWSAKRFTKKAAERALQYSISKVDPFEFLQRLLIKFGVFVPIDLCVEKAYLGGHDFSTSDLSGRPGNINNNTWLSPRYFFLPSLLGPGVPDGWTYKTPDSWKAVVCHSILFPDGVPPGLMERITAYVLSDLYTNAPAVTSSKAFKVDLLPHDEEGSIRIKEILCWRSAFYLKLGKEVTDKSSGEIQENVIEIFATLVDERSPLCVSTGTMGAGMRRLIFSGKGQAGDFGSKIYTGGYMRVIKRAIKHVTHEYAGVEFERQAICPQCLAKKACSEASCWDHSYVRAAHASGDLIVRCSYGHVCDIRLLAGLADRSRDVQPDSQVVGEVDTPVANLFNAVVIVGLWDEKSERIVRAGSGVIVDRKRGLIVTAGHTLMDKNTWREVDGKIVIGVCIDEPTAVFRYFARVLATGVDNSGVCTIDACVLQITTRMESDSLDGGKDIGFTPETLLFNNPDAMKRENLPQLKLSQRFELDEVVRILGFNQGGEGLIGPGERLNRNADFARGYVVMRFTREESLPSFNRTFLPYEEIVVICPTRSGHSGGPCVNQSGEVIGILSRADPADPQRCYLVPSTEFKKLIKASKRRLKSTIMEGVPL